MSSKVKIRRVRRSWRVIMLWKIRLGSVFKMPNKLELNWRGIKNYWKVWRIILMLSNAVNSKNSTTSLKLTPKFTEKQKNNPNKNPYSFKNKQKKSANWMHNSNPKKSVQSIACSSLTFTHKVSTKQPANPRTTNHIVKINLFKITDRLFRFRDLWFWMIFIFGYFSMLVLEW